MTHSRFRPSPPITISSEEGSPLPLSTLETLAAEGQADDRVLQRTLLAAGVLHLVLLAWQLPAVDAALTVDPAPRRVVTVLTTTRFSEPEVDVEPPPIERAARHEPVPDPDPTDPEPVRDWVEASPPETSIDPGDIVWDIPAEPPPFDDVPIRVTGEVVAPRKLHAPAPPYPEMARRIRHEGLAIVEAIIDVDGLVTNVRLLRDPGKGLGEAAVSAIRDWRFEAATLGGRPVAVYYTLTINFSIEG